MTSYRLSSEFWRSFAASTWEREPRVYRGLFGGRLLCPEEELFRVIAEETARYAQVAGSSAHGRRCRLSVDRSEVIEPLDLLPRAGDGDFHGWSRRMYREIPGRDFSLNMSSIQAGSTLLYGRYRQFLAGLFEEIGLPPGHVDSDVFIGDYRETPFGVHKDIVGNFSFLVSGPKRLLLWPYETLLPYVRGTIDPRPLDYALPLATFQDIREEPIVLEGVPGDVFYWPGHFWHCAEGGGTLSVTNNLAILLRGSPLSETFRSNLLAALRPLAGTSFFPIDPPRRRGLAMDMPGPLRAAAQRAAAELRSSLDGPLERELELTWLRYVSGGGFLQVPPPCEPPPLGDRDAVAAPEDAGLVWRRLAGGEIAVAANGHATCFADSARLVRALELLLGGGAHRVGALVGRDDDSPDAGTGRDTGEDVRRLLSALGAGRALAIHHEELSDR
jgi:hypothetical protein